MRYFWHFSHTSRDTRKKNADISISCCIGRNISPDWLEWSIHSMLNRDCIPGTWRDYIRTYMYTQLPRFIIQESALEQMLNVIERNNYCSNFGLWRINMKFLRKNGELFRQSFRPIYSIYVYQLSNLNVSLCVVRRIKGSLIWVSTFIDSSRPGFYQWKGNLL